MKLVVSVIMSHLLRGMHMVNNSSW